MSFELLHWLIAGVAWFLSGMLLATLGVNQILSMLFFDLPTACSFVNAGRFKTKAPVFIYLVSLIVLGALTAGGLWLALVFADAYLNTFYWGLGLTVLLSIGDLTDRPKNLKEFVATNHSFLSAAALQNLQEKYPYLALSLSENPQEKSRFQLRPGFLQRFVQLTLSVGKHGIAVNIQPDSSK